MFNKIQIHITLATLIISFSACLSHSYTQTDDLEYAVTAYINAGYSRFISELDYKDLNKNGFSGTIRLMWEPEHLLSIGIESGYLQLYDISTQLDELRNSGLPMLDVLNTGEKGDTYELRKAAYHKALRNLQPGVNQIIVHLSGDDAEIRHITNSWQRRHDELRIFTDSDTRKLIEELGIKLIGWREMKAQMPSKEKSR